MHGLLGGDVGNGERAVERVANAAASEHSSTEKRWSEGRKVLWDQCALHAEDVIFVFDVEASDVRMERNLLCDVRDTALLCRNETSKCFSEKRSARLVDVLDLTELPNGYRRD